MKDRLAERVLAEVMGWGPAEVAFVGPRLQMLSSIKYDLYEGYKPGVKFLEHLSGWLDQFDAADRRVVLDFVLDDLIFISRAELDHLIETVYPDFIRPMIVAEAADRLGCSRFEVSRVVNSQEFRQIERRLLVLGLSDGARIDRLRRSSPTLSHEQIYLAADLSTDAVRQAVEALREAVADPTARFEHVLLVDDFYGSGTTLIRPDEARPGGYKGRLARAGLRLEKWQEAGLLVGGYRVTILVYIASEVARRHAESALAAAGLPWRLRIVQVLSDDLRVSDADLIRICDWHYDKALVDRHKPTRAPLGFGEAALPVVLSHNAPNNSVCVLWADTTDREKSLGRRALFPRYERHREDRA